MTTATTTTYRINPSTNDSFYAERFYKFVEREWNDSTYAKNEYFNRWGLYNVKFENVKQIQRIGYTIQEQLVGGFQLLIYGIKWRYRDVFDKSNELVTNSWIEESEIGGFGNWVDSETYVAYAYRIGTDNDKITELGWQNAFTTFGGTCASNSLTKTLNLALKKLSVYNKVLDNLGTLIQLSNNWAQRSELQEPYNLFVGDSVWFMAFGRVRNGIIVDTTGSRFVVGYVTPSNRSELKYKILSMSQMRIKP